MQKPKDERVCLIDNFEEILLSDASAKKFLNYLTSSFGIVVVAKNHTLDIIDPLTFVETNDFLVKQFHILMIQPVKHTFRDRMIDKWLMLDATNGGDTNSLSFDMKKRQKDTQLQAVMQNNYFNRTPLDMLLILSYLDQEQPTRLNYSRYSYIYDSLILEKLNTVGDKVTSKISVYKMILQMLAYDMYIKGFSKWFSEQDLYRVLFDYMEKYSGEKTNASDIVKRLVSGGFLENRADRYSFKYSYMYYYFVSSYIDGKMAKDEQEKIVHNIFSNIDDDVNYNIALFLAYNMNKEHMVIPLIEELEKSILVDFSDFEYEQIGQLMREWGDNIEKYFNTDMTVPTNKDIPELRRRVMVSKEITENNKTHQDDNNEHEETQDNREEVVPEEIKQRNKDVKKIRRLVDFMGNMLKNYSGEMENTYRIQAIDLMFRSVLKILGAFFSFSQFTVNKLIDMLEKQIKEGDEQLSGAKSELIEVTKFLFSELMNQYVAANIMYLSHVLGTNTIRDNIRKYTLDHSNEFVRMLQLDYDMFIAETKLPVSLINTAFSGKNALSSLSKYIIKQNIVSYLCDYQYDYRDKQAVCATLNVKISDVFVEENKKKVLE